MHCQLCSVSGLCLVQDLIKRAPGDEANDRDEGDSKLTGNQLLQSSFFGKENMNPVLPVDHPSRDDVKDEESKMSEAFTENSDQDKTIMS